MEKFITDDLWCADVSADAQEPLFGTAVEANVWLLLEYRQSWGAKAVPESTLDPTVKTFLVDFPEMISANSDGDKFHQGRVQFIRRPQRLDEELILYIAITYPDDSRLYRFEMNDYQELLNLDIPMLVNDATTYTEHLTDECLYLICTNGKRDRCCAKYGVNVYNELMTSDHASQVWQTTHLGGHRFAATALCLPHGIAYGRIDDVAHEIVDRHQEQQIHLQYLRGRTAYPKSTQAAEAYLLQSLNQQKIPQLILEKTEQASGNVIITTFYDSPSDTHYKVRVKLITPDTPVLKACDRDGKELVATYQLIDITTT